MAKKVARVSDEDKEIEQLRSDLVRKRAKSGIKASKFLSSGSTLLNLALSGRTIGAYIKGCYHYIVGDSAAGKTWLALAALAEAAANPNFDDYRLIYDNTEDGALMDIGSFFGKRLAKRIEAPTKSGDMSETIENFFDNADDAVKDGRPFIYILDSMDALSSDAEQDKNAEQKKARAKGREVVGSFGDGKAKKNSTNLRILRGHLKKNGSILIIISQTRDNLGFTMSADKKTRSGGRALRFYATTEVWFSLKGKIQKKVKGKTRNIGVTSIADVKKNRLNGRSPKVQIPIYNSSGVDDVGSCVDFMLSEGFWKSSSAGVNATDLDLKLPKEELIRKIEQDDMETELRVAVAEAWHEIERLSAVDRKPRYE